MARVYRQTINTCVMCGASFEGHILAKVCSPECREARGKEHQKKRRKTPAASEAKPQARTTDTAKKIRVCVICGNVFVARTSRSLACSPACRDIRRRAALANRKAAHSARLKSDPEYAEKVRKANRDRHHKRAAIDPEYVANNTAGMNRYLQRLKSDPEYADKAEARAALIKAANVRRQARIASDPEYAEAYKAMRRAYYQRRKATKSAHAQED